MRNIGIPYMVRYIGNSRH